MPSPLDPIRPRNLQHLAFYLERLLAGRLWAKILVAMALGIAVGIALGPTVGLVPPSIAVPIGEWLALPGRLFLTVIQMIVVPLVVAAVIRGLAASSDIDQLRRGGILLAVYFVGTTILATVLGIVLGIVIGPGRFVDPEVAQSLATGAAPTIAVAAGDGISVATLPNQIISILPSNPLGAMVEGQMLQVVLFSLLLGVALVSVAPATSKPLLDLMGSLQAVCMAIVGWIMRLAPYAVFGLIARVMLATGLGVLVGVAVYVVTVLVGLVLLFVVFVAIAMIWGGRRPAAFMRDIRDTQLIAFSTDSSAATLPVSIRTAEEKLGVRPAIAQLVMPLGASVNMGGTALYQGLATMFMAQLFGLSLPLSSLVALVVTALGASIGAPATPGVGVVVLATVLQASGIPLAGLTLILGVDQILERARTVLNVTGDLVAATVMERALPERTGQAVAPASAAPAEAGETDESAQIEGDEADESA